MREKCPLNYRIVWGANCLSPYVIVLPKLAKQRVRLALEVFVTRKHFCEIASKKIEKEYI